jgi:lysozyme family protein/peptidoglycan hydrolase-like protein with peptidoglycan-binding domain
MARQFEDLKADYAELWHGMQVRPEKTAEVDRIARALIALKPRYQAVARPTGVPWAVIAVLHQRESDADFRTYLGNGEPLTRQTRLVPAGRGPFESWEAGAIDALKLDGLDKVDEWTPERACYEIEKFNGFGYRNNHPEVKSPYLWSFSNIYSSGKYVADGRFSAAAVDQQCGAMPALKRIMELDASARLDGVAVVSPPTAPADADALVMGSTGERVRTVQTALAQLAFPVGDVDGEFGPITSAAVSAFQSAYGLPPTGVADRVTQQTLAAALAGGAPAPAQAKVHDIVQALVSALLARARSAPPDVPSGPQADPAGNALQLILTALIGRQPAPAQGGAIPPEANVPILSPIDKLLGGQALVGKKTALSIVAYAVLAILQAAGVVGAATPAGQIVTVVIAAFGALGGVSKVDRVIQALAMIAAKVPKGTPAGP